MIIIIMELISLIIRGTIIIAIITLNNERFPTNNVSNDRNFWINNLKIIIIIMLNNNNYNSNNDKTLKVF